jgi:hypothetical protein
MRINGHQYDESLIEDIVDEVVVQGALDWVNLAVLNVIVTQASSDHDVHLSEETKVRLGLEVARRIISCGFMEPGNITIEGQGFSAWDLGVDSAVIRVETSWREAVAKSGSRYSLSSTLYGLNIWLANTPAGEEYANQVRPKVENIWKRRTEP